MHRFLPSRGTDDLELARRVADGDVLAFDEIHRRHRPAAARVCRGVLGCPHDAADATQQTFVKLFKRLSAGHVPASNLKAYLLCIARRESFEVIARRRPSAALDEETAVERDAAPTVVDSLWMRETARALPERHRKVLLMRGAGLSYDEIGDQLSLNRNAVAQLLFRARASLVAGMA
jgi:RNA polymerase sigma factor (sigma-70 family)